MKTSAGTGSFWYRVSSEPVWDKLQFFINGTLQSGWSDSALNSGEVGWLQYQFAVLAGTNTFEWRYQKDFITTLGEDAAYIDNVDLPVISTALGLASAKLTLFSVGNSYQVQLAGQSGLEYVIQASPDLVNWQPIATSVATNGVIRLTEPGGAGKPSRFYRAVAR